MFIYNTLTRSKETFKAIKSGNVGLYTCGSTVYFYSHIGNMRTYVQEDVLKRVLKHEGYNVKHIQNITDVGHLVSDADEGEDKLRLESEKEHKSMAQIADFYTKAFLKDLDSLNIILPSVMPKATEHIPDMIALVKELEEKGFIYRAKDGMYFDTSKFDGYGALTGMSFERLNNELKGGARVKMIEGKRNITDFVVWRFAHGNETEMIWDSPWGRGFPGWHIECSAMSMKYLGEHFDMHCGGIDHIAIHHTNEIAQSEGATGRKFVNYWVHTNFLNINGRKIAKSEGDLYTVQYIIDKGYSQQAIRLFLISGHYRQSLNFTFEALGNTENTLIGIYSFLERVSEINEQEEKDDPEFMKKVKILQESFFKSMSDDMNISEALSSMHSIIKEANTRMASHKMTKSEAKAVIDAMLEIDTVLGLDFNKYTHRRKQSLALEIQALVDERENARKTRNFKRADEIRDMLKKKYGVMLEDTDKGVRWKVEKG